MFLKQIVEQKREEIRGKQGKRYLSDLKSKIADARATRDFREALERELIRSDGSDRSDRSDRRSAPVLPRLIAEIKKASPSKGLLRERFDPIQIANSYQESGASAISVLTDERFFQGSLAQLGEVQEKVRLPILQKDFILDPIQIYEARAFGADAVLLIAALLEPAQIKDYIDLAEELSMDAVVEVHDEREMEQVIEPAKIIGINNRDLETFKTDLGVTFRVIREIPDSRIVVSESGISCHDDVRRLAEAGADAILVGESLMASEDIGAKIRELLGKNG